MEDNSARMTKAFQQMLDDLEKRYITPQRKQGFLCAAACCDKAPNSHALQHCVAECEQPSQMTAQMVDASLKEFQGRLQRCAVRCQDQAQDSLRPDASESEMKRAQAALESCAVGCLREYEKKLPKLKQDLEQQLKRGGR